MDKARYLVEAHGLGGRPVSELAAAHGAHRSWIYKLLARYRAPRSSPNRTSAEFVGAAWHLGGGVDEG